MSISMSDQQFLLTSEHTVARSENTDIALCTVDLPTCELCDQLSMVQSSAIGRKRNERQAYRQIYFTSVLRREAWSIIKNRHAATMEGVEDE